MLTMNQFFVSLISVLLFISIGYLARQFKLLDLDIGKKIIKFLFTIPLPILVFSSFASNPIETQFLSLPLIACLITISLMAISYLVGKALKYDRKTLGTLMTASGISSTLLFALPFIAAFYGPEQTRYLFLYDFGNGLMAWTLVYYWAGRMGNKHGLKISDSIKIFLKNPMIWALVLGVIVALSGLALPPVVKNIANQMGGFTNPLILCCVGIFLNLNFFKQKENLAKILLGMALVMGVSIGLAFTLTALLGITGIVQKIVLICGLAPAGTLTVAFSAEHDLNTEYASALVAATMFFAILLMPLLIAI